jgi:heterotetrameric sarcosine oxidase gamma subunit
LSELLWTDSLSAPRSLATRGNTAVVVIEDPGVIEIHLAVNDLYLQRRCSKILGADLPGTVWGSVVSDDMRFICVRPWRWQIIAPRERVRALMAAFAEGIGKSILSDLTGGFSSFRILGDAAGEILARVCPLDLRGISADQARGTSIAQIRCLIVREQGSSESWLVFAPRSYAEHVGLALAEAARTPGRLALFQPGPAPPL